MDVWRRMIAAQGGDPDAALPVAKEHEVMRADVDGVVIRMDAMAVGVAAGAWEPDGLARRTRYPRERGSSCMPSRATASSRERPS